MGTTHWFSLAQDDISAGAGVVFWSACLLVLVVGLFSIAMYLRKRLSPKEDFHGDGFTLSDLRRLHKAGKMSNEEFEKTKQVLVAGLSQRTAPPANPLSGGPNLRSVDKPQ